MSLQEALKLLRLELGMTQEDLAKKLNRAFVTVNRWENGKGFPSRGNAKDILSVARKCGASDECVDYLYEVLMPETKRVLTAASYGFPDIDREFMFQLADASTNAVYVLEAETYHILYANRMAEKYAVRYLTALGVDLKNRKVTEQSDKRCFYYFANREETCTFCPLKDFGKAKTADKIITLPEIGGTYHFHARKAKMKGRDVFVIYLNDVMELLGKYRKELDSAACSAKKERKK